MDFYYKYSPEGTEPLTEPTPPTQPASSGTTTSLPSAYQPPQKGKGKSSKKGTPKGKSRKGETGESYEKYHVSGRGSWQPRGSWWSSAAGSAGWWSSAEGNNSEVTLYRVSGQVTKWKQTLDEPMMTGILIAVVLVVVVLIALYLTRRCRQVSTIEAATQATPDILHGCIWISPHGQKYHTRQHCSGLNQANSRTKRDLCLVCEKREWKKID